MKKLHRHQLQNQQNILIKKRNINKPIVPLSGSPLFLHFLIPTPKMKPFTYKMNCRQMIILSTVPYTPFKKHISP